MPTEPLAAAARAIQSGDVDALRVLLAAHPELATARLPADQHGTARTLLHVVADWPGHVARGAESVAVLVAAGADVDARAGGGFGETALHWAASSDDVAVLDALLDAGADIEVRGAVIAGGTALDDARAFGQWQAARRLVARGAHTGIEDAAALGMTDRLAELVADAGEEDVHRAFWYACHGDQLGAAQFLLELGADVNWLPPWEEATALDIAERSHAGGIAAWLPTVGGCRASDR